VRSLTASWLIGIRFDSIRLRCVAVSLSIRVGAMARERERTRSERTALARYDPSERQENKSKGFSCLPCFLVVVVGMGSHRFVRVSKLPDSLRGDIRGRTRI
jgi:hypothetical protein